MPLLLAGALSSTLLVAAAPAPPDPSAGVSLILERSSAGLSCRAASEAERSVLADRPGAARVHVLPRRHESLAASAGLHVVLRGTDQLEAHPEAKSAFLRAAARWESLVTSPITIVLDVDYGATFFGEPFLSPTVSGATLPQLARFSWGTVRPALVTSADTPARQALYSSLPTGAIPSDRGPAASIVAPAPPFRALGLLPAVEDPDNEGALGPPARIGFRDQDVWDFDPSDGITMYREDFDAVVMHEIGHALGFVSEIGSPAPLVLSLLDLYRFRPSAAEPDLATTPRVLSSGGEQVFFARGAQLPLSTRGNDNLAGAFQASHWNGEWLGPALPIGVMDPGSAWEGRVVVTSRDLAALDAMGLKTVGTPPPEPSVRTIPIVLDVAGVGGARFSTELTLANRSIGDADVTLAYTPAAVFGGQGAGTASVHLPALHQLLIPDALQWLRDHGVPVPASGNQGGTLKVTFLGDDSRNFFYAGARTTSPAGTGRAGLAYPAVRRFAELTGRSYVFGLRESATGRSNLALFNLGGESVTLRVTLHPASGDAPVVLPDQTLEPGEWTQLSRVLAGPGLSSAWATIDPVAGSSPAYGAYGVVNDNTSNDGSYAEAVPDPLYAETQYVPVIVETSTFSSELVLTNPSARPVTATLTYLESLSPASGAGGKATLALPAGAQVLIPAAVNWLRAHGAAIGANGAAPYAGLLTVDFADASGTAVGLAGARTSAPSPAGAFGLFTPGVTYFLTDIFSTWVFGLRQDAAARSNLAVINVGDGQADLTLHVQIYDGDTGALAGTLPAFTLPPGGWRQFDAILAAFGVKNGFARVLYDSGTGSILAYGVVNDGATPSSGATNDGSYLPSSKY